MFIGVCDEASRHAWGLHPRDGLLYRVSRDAPGGAIHMDGRPPPEGWPDAERSNVLVEEDEDGRPVPWGLNGRADGTVIECALDEENRLCYRINFGRRIATEAVFPKGAVLRKWAHVVDPHDQVAI